MTPSRVSRTANGTSHNDPFDALRKYDIHRHAGLFLPRDGLSALVEFHNERDFDIVLVAIRLRLAGRISQRGIEGALHRVSQTARINRSSPHVTDRSIGIDRCQNRTFNAINARLVHVTNRR